MFILILPRLRFFNVHDAIWEYVSNFFTENVKLPQNI